MRTRSIWVAWSLLATWTVAVAVLVTLSAVNGTFRQDALTDSVPLLLAFATFIVVGALIVGHRPENAVGWIFAAIALLAVAGALAEEYATFAVAHHQAGGVLAAWFASWAWYPTIALALLFTPLLFPDGRPPSPRWRPLAWLAGATTAAFVVLAAVQPTLELGAGRVANPIGVAAVGSPEDSPPGLVLLDLIGVLVVAAVVSLVVRFRRSRGEERLQLKWFTYACALLPLLVFSDRLPDALANLLFAVVVSFLPVAAGVAVLRYRLYEIDRLINRTVVYGLVTVLLAGSTPPWSWRSGSCPAGWPATRRAGWWPGPPWPWPRCSGRPAAGSRRRSTASSTAAATTPPAPSTRSAPACATSSTWTP